VESVAHSQLVMLEARDGEYGDSRSQAGIPLRLFVTDAEVLSELRRHPDGEDRQRFALAALRLGVLSLRMASGQVDGETIRQAGQKLVGDVRELLSSRAVELTGQFAGALTQYFDPKTGLVPQRLNALVQKDGELERVLKSQISPDDSQLAKTLAAHVGEGSPLFKMLAPDEASGLRAQLGKTVEVALDEQRQKVLKEFSLDHKDSALSRLVTEISERQNVLGEDLKGQVELVVKEFSLDQPHSALSRLVNKVEAAQKSISDQFSTDNETSALNRISKLLQDTSEQIDRNLTLDDEHSSLSRLKRELATTLDSLSKRNAEFHAEVREVLASLQARKEESEKTTSHGLSFEEALGAFVSREAQRVGDVYESTGTRPGNIRHCKKGDFVTQMGPDSNAPGERIVWEAKADKSLDLRLALLELDEARKNREAGLGIFVFARASAPEGMVPFSRYGKDVVVVWDSEDPATNVYLQAAFSVARALAIRSKAQTQESQLALHELELSTRMVEKQVSTLDEVRKWGETIVSNGTKIVEKAQKVRAELEKQVLALDTHVAALKTAAAPS
jgi:hypothetical protein